MNSHSILNYLDTFLGMVVCFSVIDLIIMVLKISKLEMFITFAKAAFYGFLAYVTYKMAHKTGLESTNPNDYLIILTFTLASFEAVQNLLSIIRSFVNYKDS